MKFLTKKEFKQLKKQEKNVYRNEYANSVVMTGTLCIVDKPTSTKIYRVKQHYPPGTRTKYKKLNTDFETQVQCVLHVSLNQETYKKVNKTSGLTSFDPVDLKPLDLLSLGYLRSKLDSVLRDFVSNG